MPKKNDETMIIKKVKCSGVLEVHYLEFNSAIDDYEAKSYNGKEAPVPDLREGLNILAQQVMQEFGFPQKHEDWQEPKIKDVSFDGLTVKATVLFRHTGMGMVEVKLPSTNDVTAEVVSGVMDDLKDYTSGKRRSQGNLFGDDSEANVDTEEEKKKQEKADKAELAHA